MQGMEWALNDMQSQPQGTRGIIQRSLTGGFLSADEKLLNANIPVIAAAGNSKADHCGHMYSASHSRGLGSGGTRTRARAGEGF